MISDINVPVEQELIAECIRNIPNIDFKLSLNRSTGNFFYDPWVIKDEFKNTVWEKVLNTLPYNYGEARLIKLKIETCYSAHADIDDRYHLSLIQGNSYLVDLDNKEMHMLSPNKWYEMDAGLVHSAVNFGEEDRIQLVVRKLLIHGKIENPKSVTIFCDTTKFDWRYIFDHIYSPLLNRLNKEHKLDNFVFNVDQVSFTTEHSVILPKHNYFKIVE